MPTMTRSTPVLRERSHAGAGSRLAAFAQLLRLVNRVMAERRALETMDDQQLVALGLSRAQATQEAARPFWDLPTGR